MIYYRFVILRLSLLIQRAATHAQITDSAAYTCYSTHNVFACTGDPSQMMCMYLLTLQTHYNMTMRKKKSRYGILYVPSYMHFPVLMEERINHFTALHITYYIFHLLLHSIIIQQSVLLLMALSTDTTLPEL